MIQRSVSDELIETLKRLGDREQRRVLDYARSISEQPPRGTRAEDLKAYLGSWTEADASKIEAAIEEACEQVNLDAW